MATFKTCVSCNEILALYLFVGKKGVVCRKCLNPKKYAIWSENLRKKNDRWKEKNPQRVKESSLKSYHNRLNEFADNSLKIQLILKRDSYEFNLFLKKKGVTDPFLINN